MYAVAHMSPVTRRSARGLDKIKRMFVIQHRDISPIFLCVHQNQAHQPSCLIVRPMLMMVGRRRRAPLMMFGGWGSVRSDYNCPAQSESTHPSSPRMRRVPSNQILAPDPPQRRHHLPYPALIWAPSSSTSGATCPQWTFYLALQPIHIPSMST